MIGFEVTEASLGFVTAIFLVAAADSSITGGGTIVAPPGIGARCDSTGVTGEYGGRSGVPATRLRMRLCRCDLADYWIYPSQRSEYCSVVVRMREEERWLPPRRRLCYLMADYISLSIREGGLAALASVGLPCLYCLSFYPIS